MLVPAHKGQLIFPTDYTDCAQCGYPRAKLRSYEWGQKAKRRKTTGTGRMRYLKNVSRRFKNGFRYVWQITVYFFVNKIPMAERIPWPRSEPNPQLRHNWNIVLTCRSRIFSMSRLSCIFYASPNLSFSLPSRKHELCHAILCNQSTFFCAHDQVWQARLHAG